jgi:hypothetical protein
MVCPQRQPLPCDCRPQVACLHNHPHAVLPWPSPTQAPSTPSIPRPLKLGVTIMTWAPDPATRAPIPTPLPDVAASARIPRHNAPCGHCLLWIRRCPCALGRSRRHGHNQHLPKHGQRGPSTLGLARSNRRAVGSSEGGARSVVGRRVGGSRCRSSHHGRRSLGKREEEEKGPVATILAATRASGSLLRRWRGRGAGEDGPTAG